MDINHIADKEHYSSGYDNDMFSLPPDFPLGGVVLDVAERDLTSIVTRVVDHMIASDQIPADQRDQVIRILLRKRISSLATDNSEERPNSSRRRSSARIVSVSNPFPLSNPFNPNSTDDPTVVSNGTVPKDTKNYTLDHSFTQVDIDDNLFLANKDSVIKATLDGQELTAVMAGGVSFLKSPILTFVRLSEGVLLGDLTEVSMPVRFIFVLLGPFHEEKDYYEIGRSISALMANQAFREVAYTTQYRDQLLSAAEELLSHATWTTLLGDTVVTHDKARRESILMKNAQLAASAGGGDGGDQKPPPRDPLIRVGKPFYGLIMDIKSRYAMYPSDILDGLNLQVAAATIFIFFACLSPAITFGGMYSDVMDNYIGVGECLLMSCVNGVIFALFAAQPLLIVGATGPLMVFDISLYQFTQTYELDFLSMRVWIGMWMLVIGVLVAAFEASVIMRKLTRFTEEIFATMICAIFIYEAVTKMVSIFIDHPVMMEYTCEDDAFPIVEEDVLMNKTKMAANTTAGDVLMVKKGSPQPNTALLALILMLGTYIIAIKLKNFRNSKFLGRSVRRSLGDFGVPIGIFLMVLMDYLIRDQITDKLTMPEGLQPSNPDIRGWIINPLGQVKPLPVWCMFAAGPAAILVFFLVFLEGSICQLLLSKPERKLVKGTGFHLDVMLSCVINFVSGLLGAPFMGPACIRTVAHTAALTVTTRALNPGEPPKIEYVREQRLSSLVLSIFIGLGTLLSSALNLVPKPVLLGIFLYMGTASTAGIQFLERIVLLFMPVKYHPDAPYVKKVRTMKMHFFTVVQLMALGMLFGVKQSPAALVLPFVLILLVPLRLFLLPLIFTKAELSALDGVEAVNTDDTDEPDFYEASHALPTEADHHHQN
nr:anion exchange protein 2-like [Procambarus clarkii]